MKPGAVKLLEYLKHNDDLKLSESVKIHPFWTEKAIHRFAKEYSDVFAIEDGVIKLKKTEIEGKLTDQTSFVNVCSTIGNELERYLVGPFQSEEVLGLKKSPMALYLTGKLVPFGSTSDVLNEEEHAMGQRVGKSGSPIVMNISE